MSFRLQVQASIGNCLLGLLGLRKCAIARKQCRQAQRGTRRWLYALQRKRRRRLDEDVKSKPWVSSGCCRMSTVYMLNPVHDQPRGRPMPCVPEGANCSCRVRGCCSTTTTSSPSSPTTSFCQPLFAHRLPHRSTASIISDASLRQRHTAANRYSPDPCPGAQNLPTGNPLGPASPTSAPS